MNKNIGVSLLVIGILTLAAAILCAFWIGGMVVPVLTISSILLNSAGITVLTHNKKRQPRQK